MMWEDVRVLLVEDNPADAFWLRKAVAEISSGRRIDLVHAERLETALALLEAEPFDLVLLDLFLPDCSGLQTVMRTHAKAPAVPILVLSGLDDEALAIKAVREGAQDYLVKGHMDGPLLWRAMRYAIERRHAVEALHRREEHYRSLIENALDLISILNHDGTIRYVSPSHERSLGYRPEELVGVNALRFVHPEDLPEARDSLRAGAASLEFRFRHRNGSWRVLESFGRNLLHVPGVQGIVVNSRDITERKRVEEALRQANQTLRAVIHTSPLAIYSTDLEGRIKSWNRAAQAIFGWAEWELLDRPLPHIVDCAVDGSVDAARQRREHAESADLDIGREARCRRRDGSLVDVNIWSALLKDSSGEASGIVDVLADVTARRRLEEQLHHSQRLEAVGRLAGGVAHDFNNLLMIISGYSGMLLERLAADDPSRGDAQEIQRAAERATDLTKRLLAFSSRQGASPRVLDLNVLVRDMDRMLRRVIGEHIELVTRLHEDVLAVEADPGQIEQVVLNLALNARDAMLGGGRLTIETGAARVEDSAGRGGSRLNPGDYVVLTVSDTGLGIDAEAQAHVFEPFFTTKEDGKGTGLGLSTSYGVVKQNGGEITFRSEPGTGAAFSIFLPAAARRPEPAAPPDESPPPRGSETILLVEDEDGVRHVVTAMLERNGYRVLPAASPAEALKRVAGWSGGIDLLITDMVMPGMSGRDLARAIASNGGTAQVLFMSAGVDPSAVDHTAAFLRKPFTPEALALKVKEVLAGRP